MAQTDHYARCNDDAAKSTLEEFVRRWPGYYLLVNIPGGEADGWEMDPLTNVVSIDELKAGRQGAGRSGNDDDEAEALPGTYLFEVKKHADNSWLEWIAVGRARNNDLVLRHQSVSKLHARIHLQKEAAAGAADRRGFLLTDMRSKAGTTVNSAFLKPSEPFPLNPGDEIGLGMVICEFLDSGALYRRLTAADW
ncbi:MAG: FHA domain-containing protein [Proteobacteria bacterium]|jgi:hypothetical protein|nr:FHA domain-containing protein [Pseudomonadota bacterium]